MRFALEKAGHEVVEASDGTQAFALFCAQRFDLAVLDIVMPEDDGLELCRKIRKQSDLPIIFVSSRDEELDRVLGLEIGADDYLTKPFSPRELSARVSAVLRRVPRRDAASSQTPAPAGTAVSPLVHGPLELDPVRHRFRVAGADVTLTVTEFALLHVLMQSPGRVFSRTQLVEQAYGHGHFITDRTVDSHIRRVRQKLGSHAAQVATVYGVGYRLEEG
jgi:two-component system OmpR family response regulator